MATEDASSVRSPEGRHDIISALSSAILEWLLMFMLFIDAFFSYSITRFACYCKLQVPCLFCSRLDRAFGNVKRKFYWDLICGNHKQEISSLVFCRMHNKLGDVNGMCESCLFSFATIDKTNAETYRLLVGKMGPRDSRESDEDAFFSDCEYSSRICSCCNCVWTSKIRSEIPLLSTKSVRLDHTELDALLSVDSEYELKKRKLGEETSSRSFKGPLMMRNNSFEPPLYDAGYTKVKITSDTESEDVILENGDDEHQNINVNHDLDSERLIHLDSLSELDEMVASGYDLKKEKKAGENTISRYFKASLMMRKDTCDPPLFDAGYTKVKITSDTESEGTIPDNGADEHQDINSNQELDLERLIHLDSLSGLGKLLDGEYELKKIGEQTTSKYFKAPLRKNSCDPPLDDAGYTKLKIASDTESEDAIPENGDHEHLNFNQDLGLERLIHLNSFSELDQMVDSQVVLVDVDNSVTAVGHGLEELNWSQVQQSINDESSTKRWKHFEGACLSSDIIAVLREEVTTPTLEQKVDGMNGMASEIETSPKLNHVAGDVEQDSGYENGSNSRSRDSPVVRKEIYPETNIIGDENSLLFPNDLELGDAYKLAIGNKPRQLSGKFLQQISQKESTRLSEDLKLLLSQMSSNRVSELPPYDISPRMSVISRTSLERNESGISIDGSIVGEIEGENEVDRLKRQAEHDKRIMNALYKELDEERNASAIAANQAMAMITKLQEEKAAVHMEALQCIRVMEEQAEYDVEALHKTNQLLMDKEKEVQDLEYEIEYYRIKFGNVSMMEDDDVNNSMGNLRKLANKLLVLSHDGIEEGDSVSFNVDSVVGDISSLIERLELERTKTRHSYLETR